MEKRTASIAASVFFTLSSTLCSSVLISVICILSDYPLSLEGVNDDIAEQFILPDRDIPDLHQL